MLPLFDQFPELAKRVPYIGLGKLPTFVNPLPGLMERLGHGSLFIKRDDISGTPYGGNKVRKLEFVLADARARGAVRVITIGAAGSNHALATAVYGQKCDLKVTLVLFDQPASDAVRVNLLMDYACNADMVFVERYEDVALTIDQLTARYRHEESVEPVLIPGGGSSIQGVLGYLNAAFELKAQIEQGMLPLPHEMYVPLGTMGTLVGLVLGIKAAGLKTRVIGVRVVPPGVGNIDKCVGLGLEAHEWIRKFDPSFPDFAISADDFTIDNDWYEPGYGLCSSAVSNAVSLIEKTDAIHLDTTYSGKAFAAFCAAARSSAMKDKTILFWDTKNSRNFDDAITDVDFRELPLEFHRYFVQ